MLAIPNVWMRSKEAFIDLTDFCEALDIWLRHLEEALRDPRLMYERERTSAAPGPWPPTEQAESLEPYFEC